MRKRLVEQTDCYSFSSHKLYRTLELPQCAQGPPPSIILPKAAGHHVVTPHFQNTCVMVILDSNNIKKVTYLKVIFHIAEHFILPAVKIEG